MQLILNGNVYCTVSNPDALFWATVDLLCDTHGYYRAVVSETIVSLWR